jgi:hypothetical protein
MLRIVAVIFLSAIAVSCEESGSWSVKAAEVAAVIAKEDKLVVAVEKVALSKLVHLTHPDRTLPGCNCGSGKPPVPQEVVMGVATGYAWGQISNFVVSLRNTGYAGDIILGMNAKNQAESMQRELSKYCVTAIAASYNMSYLPDMPIASRRFLLYLQWLQELGYQPSTRVLVVDVRDTIFQREPFADFNEYSANGRDLMLFADNHPLSKDGTADFHTYLLHGTCFDKSTVKNLVTAEEKRNGHGALMLCSGSTMGTAKRMLGYLQAMRDAFESLHCFPDGGIDQGYHNWVSGLQA